MRSAVQRILPPLPFVTALSPKYSEPTHLAPLADAFVRMDRGESVHACVFAPPGSLKSETLAHFAVRALKLRPELRIALACYGARLSTKKSRRIRALALRAGIKLDRTSASTSDWRTTTEQGGLWATSVGGAVVGERFDLILIDDPVKDRIVAESPLARERVHEWVSELAGREEPNASSILVMHRWHVDDVGGRLARDGWEVHSLPAIDSQGRALCPSRFSVADLEKIRARIGDYSFESLYQQAPRPRGGAVFRDVHTYDAIPEGASLVVVGCDFAYTSRTSSDYAAAVVLATVDGETFFVVDVVRARLPVVEFAAELARLQREHHDAHVHTYTSTTEAGIVDLMRAQGLAITGQLARGDKFTRAQPAAARWNAGKILIPSFRTPWRDAFVSEVLSFTGTSADRHDDQIDALASAFDALARVGPDDGTPDHFLVAASADDWGLGWSGSRYGGSRGYG